MNKWYFTFLMDDTKYGGKCQVVYADTYTEARNIMINKHGTKWCFQYSENEWNEANKLARKRGITLETVLPQALIGGATSTIDTDYNK